MLYPRSMFAPVALAFAPGALAPGALAPGALVLAPFQQAPPPHPVGRPATFVETFEVLLEIEGEAAGDQFGWIGRNAGDVDGDGHADILTSAPFKAIGGASAGRAYVYSGKTGELLHQWSGQPGDLFGIGIDSAGDVDADGHADLAVGAAGAGGTGAAYVYSGKTGELLHTFKGENNADNFGRRVAGAGDLNEDGHDDIIVGAPNADGVADDVGKAFVFSGADGALLEMLEGERPGDAFGSCVDGYSDEKSKLLIIGAPSAGEGQRGATYVYKYSTRRTRPLFTIESQPGDTSLGRMFVSAVGDVNADGVVDVYASDWASNANGVQGSGRIYVHSGTDGERLLELSGKQAGEGFGIGTSEAGDVNGDGHDDLLVGAWQNADAAASGGKCTLFSGKDGSVLRTYTCATAGDTFGFDTTSLGDLDGDDVPDFLVTAAYSYIKGAQSGRVFVIAGPGR